MVRLLATAKFNDQIAIDIKTLQIITPPVAGLLFEILTSSFLVFLFFFAWIFYLGCLLPLTNLHHLDIKNQILPS